MIRPRFLLALGLVLPATLAAQRGDSAVRGGPVRATPAKSPVVTVTYTDYAFDVPAVLPAGITTFTAVNKGKELHHGMLVKLDSGKTMADLQTVLGKPGPLPGWATLYGGPQNASTVTINLPAGNYVWVCLIPGPDGVPHASKGMIKALTVGPTKGSGSSPAADRTVTMADYTFTVSRPITAGRHVLKIVTNAKSQPHELMIIRLPAGKTRADLLAWGAHPSGPPPAEVVEGVAALGPSVVNYATMTFKRGNYVLICFVPDAKDGQSHATHGMVKEFSIR